MTRPRPKYVPEPRMLDAFQSAARLGKSEGWLRTHLDELYAQGFPRFDPLFCGWDAYAIEIWLDRRAGIAEASSDDVLREIQEWQP